MKIIDKLPLMQSPLLFHVVAHLYSVPVTQAQTQQTLFEK